MNLIQNMIHASIKNYAIMYFAPSRGSLNGFLRSLGEEGRRRNIELYTSSNYKEPDSGKLRDPWEIFSYSAARWASDGKDINPWIQINSKNHYITLRNYTIVSTGVNYSFKGWNLTASNDNFSTFHVLDSVPHYDHLSDFCPVVREIKYSTSSPPAFNSFRLTMTEKARADNFMRVCSIELFGRIFSSRFCSFSKNTRRCYLFTFLLILAYS